MVSAPPCFPANFLMHNEMPTAKRYICYLSFASNDYIYKKFQESGDCVQINFIAVAPNVHIGFLGSKFWNCSYTTH